MPPGVYLAIVDYAGIRQIVSISTLNYASPSKGLHIEHFMKAADKNTQASLTPAPTSHFTQTLVYHVPPVQANSTLGGVCGE